MGDKLKIFVCESILEEAKAVMAAEKYPDVIIKSHPPICMLPSSRSEGLMTQYLKDDKDIIYISPCFKSLHLDKFTPTTSAKTNSMCLNLIAGYKYIEYLMKEGSYTMSPVG
jgi:hypothetical protein